MLKLYDTSAPNLTSTCTQLQLFSHCDTLSTAYSACIGACLAGKRAEGCGSLQLLSHLAGRWISAATTAAMAWAWGGAWPIFTHAALVCGMVCVVGSVMDLTALTCKALYGLDIAPHFDAPFTSTSLAGDVMHP